MPHHAGVDLVIGTDFIIPAGIRIDLITATAKLSDKIAAPLLRSAREVDDTACSDDIVEAPSSLLNIESRLFRDFQIYRKQPCKLTYEIWIRRLPTLVMTIIYDCKRMVVR